MNTLQRFVRILCGLVLCLSLNACLLKPYKFTVEQGNEWDPAQIEQLHEGMSEDQVRYLLGTPLLNDVFHTNRWDYIYMEKPGYGKIIRRHVAIYFRHGYVERITRDTLED